MTTHAEIGAVVAAKLANEGTLGLLSRQVRGAYDSESGTAPVQTETVSLPAMLVGVKMKVEGTVRKLSGKACVGQTDVDVQAYDRLTIGERTWMVVGAEQLTDGTATYAWLLDVEAVWT